MQSISQVLRRLAWAPLVCLGVVTLTFVLSRLFGGDPVEQLLPSADNDVLRQALTKQLGLDQPLHVQYLRYLGAVLSGDMGNSYVTGDSVTAEIAARLPATAELSLTALVISVVLGLILGVTGAIRDGGVMDYLVRVFTATSMALPAFWVGLVLIWLFSVTLGWTPGPVGRLPAGSDIPPHITGLYVLDSIVGGRPDLAAAAARHLALPVITLVLGLVGPIARLTRSSMAEVLRSEYVRTARAFGIPYRRIWFLYALRNALLPVVTLFGELLVSVLTGAIFVETVFNWPGVGQYAKTAIGNFDFPALQGVVIFAALLYVVTYLLTDVAYALLNPQVRVGARA